MRKRLNNLFFGIGMIAVVVMFFSFDVSLTELWGNTLRRPVIGWRPYWGCGVCFYLMNAWAWRVIIQGGGPCMVGFMQLLNLTVSGFALNYATPVGLLGGEAYRIMELSKYIGVQRATSTVILFAMMHIFCPFLVLGDGCRGLLCHGFDGGCADK